MAKLNPWLVTLTLSDTNVHNLLTLLQAVDADIPAKCAQLALQWDQNAGGNGLLIGNPTTLSATVYGRRLLATQVAEFGPVESNLLRPDQIALQSENAGPYSVHVTVLTR